MPVTIDEQSERMKAAAAERLPAEVVAVFDRGIQELLDQGVPSGVVGVGDTMESFTLDDATGTPVTLIVDADRRVRFVDVQPDYTARTEVADILAALGDLGSSRP